MLLWWTNSLESINESLIVLTISLFSQTANTKHMTIVLEVEPSTYPFKLPLSESLYRNSSWSHLPFGSPVVQEGPKQMILGKHGSEWGWSAKGYGLLFQSRWSPSYTQKNKEAPKWSQEHPVHFISNSELHYKTCQINMSRTNCSTVLVTGSFPITRARVKVLVPPRAPVVHLSVLG